MSDSCKPMDYSPSGSSVHEIFQARILEWVTISFSRGSSQPRTQTQVSCTAGRFFPNWAIREAPKKRLYSLIKDWEFRIFLKRVINVFWISSSQNTHSKYLFWKVEIFSEFHFLFHSWGIIFLPNMLQDYYYLSC